MNYDTAIHVWHSIRVSRFSDLREDLVNLGIRYARVRVDYFFADNELRLTLEDGRTACHNAFIASCDILARNMARCGEDASWREQLGNDRKIIGDFACLLHAIIGIAAR